MAALVLHDFPSVLEGVEGFISHKAAFYANLNKTLK